MNEEVSGEVPSEIIARGKVAMDENFSNTVTSAKRLKEVKVVLLGEGGVGKTSLVKAITGQPFERNSYTTHGIRIAPNYLMGQGEEKIRVSIWDFGGQEVYHATHQFFLTRRSLYLLVLDARRANDNIEYWLKTIEVFGDQSPTLVVINKLDERNRDVNRPLLSSKYPNINGFYQTSCKTGEGIIELKNGILHTLTNMNLEIVWPKSWLKVRERLENAVSKFISYQDYAKVCQDEGIIDETTQSTLIGLLHDLGIVIHFKDERLRDTIVLNPLWITKAFYSVVSSHGVTDKNGLLKLTDFSSILGSIKDNSKIGSAYPKETHTFIIELMRKFERCYLRNKETLLIPDLLPGEDPNFEFEYESSLKFIISYDFLPATLISRAIVRLYGGVINDVVWKTGILLSNDVHQTHAVVRFDKNLNRATIYVNGEEKREHLSKIRQIFGELHSSFTNLEVRELVPLPDDPSITIDYEELIGLFQLGKTEVLIGKLRKSYDLAALLNTLERLPPNVAIEPSTRPSTNEGIVGDQGIKKHESEDIYFSQHIKLPEEFRIPFKQYFIYFSEFVKKSKGLEIDFEVHSSEEGLVLLLGHESEINISDINRYLSEYAGFIKENLDNLTIYAESDLSTFQADLLILELRNQIRHLTGSIENKKLEIKYLKNNVSNLNDQVEFLQYQVKKFHNTLQIQLDHPISVNVHTEQKVDQVQRNLQQGKLAIKDEKIEVTLGDGNTIYGDFSVAKKIEDSFNRISMSRSNRKLKNLLKQLALSVSEMSENLPANEAKRAAREFEGLVDEITDSSPSQLWWQPHYNRLKLIADIAGESGISVIKLADEIATLVAA